MTSAPSMTPVKWRIDSGVTVETLHASTTVVISAAAQSRRVRSVRIRPMETGMTRAASKLTTGKRLDAGMTSGNASTGPMKMSNAAPIKSRGVMRGNTVMDDI